MLLTFCGRFVWKALMARRETWRGHSLVRHAHIIAERLLQSLCPSVRPSVRPSVHLYVCKKWRIFERIVLNFDTGEFYEKFTWNLNFQLGRAILTLLYVSFWEHLLHKPLSIYRNEKYRVVQKLLDTRDNTLIVLCWYYTVIDYSKCSALLFFYFDNLSMSLWNT
jgi:hypothetical protein